MSINIAEKILCGTSKVNEEGYLEIGGCDTVQLTKEFGTPLLVYDEDLIRNNCRRYLKAFAHDGNRVAYAGKAFLSIALCQLLNEEGMYLDVVSGGELYTALKAGFPAERIYFHGNNKTEAELQMALDACVGYLVVDNAYEFALLEELANSKDYSPNVLLRVALGVDAATHKYIQTGQHDSKFGFAIHGEDLHNVVKKLVASPKFNFLGFHSHIGSQITSLTGFSQAVGIMFDIVEIYRQQYGWIPSELNLGGGLGIPYKVGDQASSIEDLAALILSTAKKHMNRVQMFPRLVLEPGRSIIGQAGTTLYKVGTIKHIPGIRTYAAVDGGMTDNPRPALYQAQYQCAVANRMREECTEVYSIAGRCCESGDMLIWDHSLPRLNSGDILAVFYTGAYNYSMASNYNRLPRPAVVMVKDGKARVIIERESYEDIIKLDKSLR